MAFQWPNGNRGALSLSFDDGRESQWRVGVPLLHEWGVRATFYVTPAAVRQAPSAWHDALAAGHEIGNHSVRHPCTGNFPWSRARALEDYTLEAMEAELREANRCLADELGVTPRTFAYPCGETYVGRGTATRSYVPVVARLFEAGRLFRSETGNDPLFCDLAQVRAFDGDGRPAQGLKALADAAAQSGGWVVLAGHDIGEGGHQATLADALRELCRYVTDPAAGIWVAPVAEVAAYVNQHRPPPEASPRGPPYASSNS